MTTLLNDQRPPVFCPGCAHDRVTGALDRALQARGLQGHQVVIVSDIGCSGLFDTFFNTHAMHGLHGRALTYATGLKMARPELTVVVTMGDGGLGIGGAHVLSACRRNLDLTLLVLNNFNYGMTGGQCSATTPADATVSSGFLNRLEKPVDVCRLAAAAGAPYVERLSAYQKDAADRLAGAIGYEGFAVVDIWGCCPGRYTKRNRLTPGDIEAAMAALPAAANPVPENERMEYGAQYRQAAAGQSEAGLGAPVPVHHRAPFEGRKEVLLLGRAGQRIVTAGELVCLAGMGAGLQTTQKNDYPITVLRGHSVSEMVLNSGLIHYTGIRRPDRVIALADEGVARRKELIAHLGPETVIIAAAGLDLPPTRASVIRVDFKALGVKSADWALAALAVMAEQSDIIDKAMLVSALDHRFDGSVRQSAQMVLDKVATVSA